MVGNAHMTCDIVMMAPRSLGRRREQSSQVQLRWTAAVDSPPLSGPHPSLRRTLVINSHAITHRSYSARAPSPAIALLGLVSLLSMDEVIFFRRPSDASHLLLFNLPHPPHPLVVDEDSLSQLCSQHGLLFQCTIHTAKDDPIINASLHPIPSPFCDDAHHTQPDTLTLTHPSTSHPSAPAAAEPAAPQWAHVHYFSVVDARAAMKALREHFRGSNVRAVWSRRREAAAADEEEGSAAGGRASAPRFWPISFAASLQVINHFLGPLHWTCSINWARRYDPAEHGHILSGQTEGSQCTAAGNTQHQPLHNVLTSFCLLLSGAQSRPRRASWRPSTSCSERTPFPARLLARWSSARPTADRAQPRALLPLTPVVMEAFTSPARPSATLCRAGTAASARTG